MDEEKFTTTHLSLSGQVRLLGQHPLLCHLPVPFLQHLIESGCLQYKAADRYLIRLDKPVSVVVFVLQGTIKLYHCHHQDGREVLVKLLQAPAMFTESEVLHQLPAMTSAVTLVSSLCLMMPRTIFLQALQDYPAFALQVFYDVTMRFCRAMSNEKEFAFHQVIPRLARLLLAYHAVFSMDETLEWIPVSRTTLAKDLGVSRKSLIQAFGHFEQENYLTKNGLGWKITDPLALQALTQGLMPMVHSIEKV